MRKVLLLVVLLIVAPAVFGASTAMVYRTLVLIDSLTIGTFTITAGTQTRNLSSDDLLTVQQADARYARIGAVTPTPTPAPTPTPTATPTPSSSPTPRPTPTPTPSSSPGTLTLSGSTKLPNGSAFSYVFIELMNSSRVRIARIQEDVAGAYSFTVPNGTYVVKADTSVWGGSYNANPTEYVVTVCGQSVTTLNFTIGPSNQFPSGGAVTIPCP